MGERAEGGFENVPKILTRAGFINFDQANPGLTEFFLSAFWSRNSTSSTTERPEDLTMSRKANCERKRKEGMKVST